MRKFKQETNKFWNLQHKRRLSGKNELEGGLNHFWHYLFLDLHLKSVDITSP